mmetsp:Transcript_16905/g.23919  ORF Transcript_16905/g.23919 Transcript_16905/m.23919 type:complete len:576 (+) Transcript_16905:203-1930(+)|eukprot:CAMPEP_0184865710 /NCGR_PEP_ID=MMETSP0580-20130426/18808_1 /TAXON_ID=1118495 /ORGANISM="Dactyliosolen fragilissimus" /LENGTH=575 /DNA_ID=CAMNT_0027365005 /DNA_START=189 /DNA_END=1916 /DNA_ORIENTATION=-
MRIVHIFLLPLFALPRANAFQFMSKFKVISPIDQEAEARVKAKFGDKKLAVITGTSSGLGRKTAEALLRTGEYHVIGAVRDLDKMEAIAEIDQYNQDDFTPMKCELNSFESVRDFCKNLNDFKLTKPIDRLICNAGVYQPTLPYAKWSVDDHEQTMQINFLSHFLMISELIDDMQKAEDPRVIMVGSVTGNDNTVGGGGVYPIADLKDLEGFKAGFNNPIAMADGYGFDGAKAYKDSKLCLMMMSNVLHAKYNKLTGIAFSSIYPGCIAESPLFREKRKWFRKYFPVFMKYITGGFVSEQEAGQRLFQVAHDPRCSKSGVYWSWNGGPREGRGQEALEKGGQISGGGGAGGGWDSIYENDQSAKVNNIDLGIDLFRYSTEITEAKWPDYKQVRSPCPTLNVIGSLSDAMIKREELKRMTSRPGFNADGTPIITKRKKVQLIADKVAVGILGNTVGRVARFASRRLLGKIPEEAITGSYHEQKKEEDSSKNTRVESNPNPKPESLDLDDQLMLEEEISKQIFNGLEEDKIDITSENSDALVMESDRSLIEKAMENKNTHLPSNPTDKENDSNVMIA